MTSPLYLQVTGVQIDRSYAKATHVIFRSALYLPVSTGRNWEDNPPPPELERVVMYRWNSGSCVQTGVWNHCTAVQWPVRKGSAKGSLRSYPHSLPSHVISAQPLPLHSTTSSFCPHSMLFEELIETMYKKANPKSRKSTTINWTQVRVYRIRTSQESISLA